MVRWFLLSLLFLLSACYSREMMLDDSSVRPLRLQIQQDDPVAQNWILALEHTWVRDTGREISLVSETADISLKWDFQQIEWVSADQTKQVRIQIQLIPITGDFPVLAERGSAAKSEEEFLKARLLEGLRHQILQHLRARYRYQ